MKIELFYDKECPFCNSYVNYIKLKESHDLFLTNVRENETKVKELRALGFDINNGFIIKVDDKEIYQGVDAINFLNTKALKKVYFPDNFFFRNIIYPIVKFFRKLLLLILRKKSKL